LELSGTTIRSSPTPLRVSPGIAPEFRHRKRPQHSADDFGMSSRLVEQVKRNIDRFPSDFMLQLTKTRPRL
jgi:hypothetical protein